MVAHFRNMTGDSWFVQIIRDEKLALLPSLSTDTTTIYVMLRYYVLVEWDVCLLSVILYIILFYDELTVCVPLNRILLNYFLCCTGNEWLLGNQVVTGDIPNLSQPLSIPAILPAVLKATEASPSLTLSVWVYCCLARGGACMMKAASFTQPLQIGSTPRNGSVTLKLAHAF